MSSRIERRQRNRSQRGTYKRPTKNVIFDIQAKKVLKQSERRKQQTQKRTVKYKQPFEFQITRKENTNPNQQNETRRKIQSKSNFQFHIAHQSNNRKRILQPVDQNQQQSNKKSSEFQKPNYYPIVVNNQPNKEIGKEKQQQEEENIEKEDDEEEIENDLLPEIDVGNTEEDFMQEEIEMEEDDQEEEEEEEQKEEEIEIENQEIDDDDEEELQNEMETNQNLNKFSPETEFLEKQEKEKKQKSANENEETFFQRSKKKNKMKPKIFENIFKEQIDEEMMIKKKRRKNKKNKQKKKSKSKREEEQTIHSITNILNQTDNISTNKQNLSEKIQSSDFCGRWKVLRASPLVCNETYLTKYSKPSSYQQRLQLVFTQVLNDLCLFLDNRSQNIKKSKIKNSSYLQEDADESDSGNESGNENDYNGQRRRRRNRKGKRKRRRNRKKTKLLDFYEEDLNGSSYTASLKFNNLIVGINDDQKIIPTLEFLIYDQGEKIATLIFSTIKTVQSIQQEHWVQSKNQTLLVTLPLVLLNAKSNEILKQTGILQWLSQKFDCLISPVKFQASEMSGFITDWAHYYWNSIISKKQIDDHQIINNPKKNIGKKTQPIKLVYGVPVNGISDIVLQFPYAKIIQIIESGMAGKYGQNLIPLLQRQFFSVFKINLDCCILKQIIFPSFIVKKAGIVTFRTDKAAIIFLEQLYEIIW
ncbi:centromere protein l [Anaeramoeba flamelloides]|uniref:Centromere protein l n=1 Tax=Anaeramoeba flamelloides TaxID=1746091 RepID=A0ABQ8YM65_9EUKA|nr:centromere protein l [Anaeramoeba flamelloides]